MEKNIPKFIDSQILHKGRFLSFVQYNFEKPGLEENASPTKINWETVEYNVGMDHKGMGGVKIIPILNSTPQKIILIANFRYPVKKFVLEFPSGLLDYEPGQEQPTLEFIKKEAARELQEETGYEGTFRSFFTEKRVQSNIEFSNSIFCDPWKSCGSGYTCIFDVGKKTVQHLDNEEVIQVYEVEIDKLLEFITDKIEKENFGVCSDVYFFAMGLEYKKIFKE